MRLAQRALLGLAMLVVAACEDGLPSLDSLPFLQGSERTEEKKTAPGAFAQDDQAFGLLRTETDLDASQPTLCLVFSQALSPTVSYEPFLDIDQSVAVTASGQRLCLSGLDYGDQARLTLLAGLPSADGRRLERDETITLSFADRRPAVRFEGNGIILPRTAADGIAISTVNIEELNVTVTKVPERSLVFKEITEGYANTEGGYVYRPYRENPSDVGREIFSGVLETSGPTNSAVTTVLPLKQAVGDLEAGAYYVHLQDKGSTDEPKYDDASAGRWFIITDLAMTVYEGTTGIDVTARSLRNARPVSEALVRLIAASNEVLAEARADRSGRVRFAGPLTAGEGVNRPKLITVQQGEDFAILDLDRPPLDLASQDVGGDEPKTGPEAFVYLDRGIYRPGETVFASALFRDAYGNAVTERPGHMALIRPNGLEQNRIRFDADELTSQGGGISKAMTIPQAASRGVWRLLASLDGVGEVGAIDFNVEDFVPQRLELHLEADDDAILAAQETLPIRADLRFLYGAAGSGLEVTGTARIETDRSAFDGLEGFSFALGTQSFRQVMLDLPATVTDGDGAATVLLQPGAEGQTATSPLRIRAVVRGEEPGGRGVQDDIIIPYRPRPTYVGVRTAFDGTAPLDEELGFEVVAVTREGAPLAGQNVSYRLVRRESDYDWYQDANGRWTWRRQEWLVSVGEGVVRTSTDGRAVITEPGLTWGQYTLTTELDGEDRASVDFFVGYGRPHADGDAAPDQVQVTAPPGAFAVGSKVTIGIQAPYAGRAEIAVANAGVINLEHIDVSEGATEVTLQVTEEWGAGAYALVSVYTDRDPDERPLPRRAVGAVYLPVDTGDKILPLTISAQDRVRPNGPVEVTLDIGVPPPSGNAWATLAAVDQGVLLLTRHKSPKPEDQLFAKTRLGVELYDDYGRILDPNRGDAGILRSGGDQIGGAGLSVVPTKTVALFEGPVSFDRRGQARVELDLPDFNGELRLMAVIWSKIGVGSADQSMTVRDKIPAELVLPRFLAPGDQALATLTLDNVEWQAGDYVVSLMSDQPDVLAIEQSAMTVSLGEGERRDQSISIRADSVGVANLSLSVEGPGGFQASSSYPMEVRSPFLPYTTITTERLDPQERYTVEADVFDDFLPGSGTLMLSASFSPIDPAGLASELTRYPYQCTEQVVSRATGYLFAPERDLKTEGELRLAIETLLERQSTDGSFGLWRMGDRRASPWLGAYAVDFLQEAADRGLPVPDEALRRAYSALQPISQGEVYRAYGYDVRSAGASYSQDSAARLAARSEAYALYTLTRGGVVDRSRLRYVHDAKLDSIDSALAKAQLAAALAAIGDEGRARSAFSAAIQDLGYTNEGDWYQSETRDASALIELAVETGWRDQADGLLPRLVRDMDEPEFLTTQERAYLLRAAYAFAEGQTEALISDGDEAFTTRTFTPNDGITNSYSNVGEEPLYISALTRGAPQTAPEAGGNDLVVTKEWLSTTGSPIDPSAIKQGDRIIVSLRLTPQREARAQYVVSDLLPAGFEIEGVLSPRDGAPNGPYGFLGMLKNADVAEARDDRFVISDILYGTDTQTYAYLVRAVTPGEFLAPGAVAEDMYKPSVSARSVSGSVVITP